MSQFKLLSKMMDSDRDSMRVSLDAFKAEVMKVFESMHGAYRALLLLFEREVCDESPADKAWFEKIGFEQNKEATITFLEFDVHENDRTIKLQVTKGGKGRLDVYIEDSDLAGLLLFSNPTKGQMRGLFRALHFKVNDPFEQEIEAALKAATTEEEDAPAIRAAKERMRRADESA